MAPPPQPGRLVCRFCLGAAQKQKPVVLTMGYRGTKTGSWSMQEPRTQPAHPRRLCTLNFGSQNYQNCPILVCKKGNNLNATGLRADTHYVWSACKGCMPSCCVPCSPSASFVASRRATGAHYVLSACKGRKALVALSPLKRRFWQNPNVLPVFLCSKLAQTAHYCGTQWPSQSRSTQPLCDTSATKNLYKIDVHVQACNGRRIPGNS